MSFTGELRQIIEAEEHESVGNSFGGTSGKRIFSIPHLVNWIISKTPSQTLFSDSSGTEEALRQLHNSLSNKAFKKVVASALRFSFLIELTDLKVGSTKIKTRWLPGRILMPQAGSFAPIHGTFEPGNDPRAASYDECLAIFEACCNILHQRLHQDESLASFITEHDATHRVPYEFPFGYLAPHADPVHQAINVQWILNDDIRWLVKARGILKKVLNPNKDAIQKIEKTKLQVKVYKTDRALTGKDKTNRAKRWEVLFGDFQHATLDQCWSVERKLTSDLVHFEAFPDCIQDDFLQKGLIEECSNVTRCPVTLAPLNYTAFADSVLNAEHGRSDYQIGHLNPLKRGGGHVGDNVCWQSDDGNRIQGDLTIEETERLLDDIALRRQQFRTQPK